MEKDRNRNFQQKRKGFEVSCPEMKGDWLICILPNICDQLIIQALTVAMAKDPIAICTPVH
jgi:monoamine oxidase